MIGCLGLVALLFSITTAQNCGYSKVNQAISNDPVGRTRIVGGNEAVPHSWPWIVSCQTNNWHFCGGTLIPMSADQSDIVLTASHCIQYRNATNKDPRQIQVVLGSHAHSVAESGEQRVNVVKLVAHPEFSYGGMLGDVAVLKLEKPVKFSNTIAPICVAKPGQKPDSRSTCVAAGWGNTVELNSNAYPDKLQQLKVPVPDDAVCSRNDVWGPTFNNTARVCAGHLAGKRNICVGDSGGPLMCGLNNQWTQFGVSSYVYGGGCQVANKPGVFARVSTYHPWIMARANEMSVFGNRG